MCMKNAGTHRSYPRTEILRVPSVIAPVKAVTFINSSSFSVIKEFYSISLCWEEKLLSQPASHTCFDQCLPVTGTESLSALSLLFCKVNQRLNCPGWFCYLTKCVIFVPVVLTQLWGTDENHMHLDPRWVVTIMPLLCFSLYERLCFPAPEYVWNWCHCLQHNFNYIAQKEAPPAGSTLWVPAAGWSFSWNQELAVGSSAEHVPFFQQLLFVHSS